MPFAPFFVYWHNSRLTLFSITRGRALIEGKSEIVAAQWTIDHAQEPITVVRSNVQLIPLDWSQSSARQVRYITIN